MDEWGIDCSIVSTQKALGCMPGLGFIAFSERARAVIPTVQQPRCYFDAVDYERNLARGQLPFTPSIFAILQVKRQLENIRAMGLGAFVERHRRLAQVFREAVLADPRFGLLPDRPSNAISAVTLPPGVATTPLVRRLREASDSWFATNHTGAEHYCGCRTWAISTPPRCARPPSRSSERRTICSRRRPRRALPP
jgi:aspartate aminotransferase-like enzyme